MRPNKRKSAESAPEGLRLLWEARFFEKWVDQEKISSELNKRHGNNFFPDTLRMALSRASYLVRRTSRGFAEYIQKKPAVSKETLTAEIELFDDRLIDKLGISFTNEIEDLHLNFGRNGDCSAFLLRKILEKLIFITFSKNGLGTKIEDKSRPGRLIGLEAMIDVASREKIAGMPFLTAKTAEAVKGVKFLGDTSAHNPLTNVDMKTIIPQMPYIITAYKELVEKL